MKQPQPRDNDLIRQNLLQVAKQHFPGVPDVNLQLGVDAIINANPNATYEDFHKGAQQLAAGMKNGNFHKELAKATIKHKLKKKEK